MQKESTLWFFDKSSDKNGEHRFSAVFAIGNQ